MDLRSIVLLTARDQSDSSQPLNPWLSPMLENILYNASGLELLTHFWQEFSSENHLDTTSAKDSICAKEILQEGCWFSRDKYVSLSYLIYYCYSFFL